MFNLKSFIKKVLKEDEERKLGECLADQISTPYVVIYRACAKNVFEFKNKDYVTLSKKFAIEHAESGHIYHEEQQHVIQTLVNTKNVYDAYNPGEYFYVGKDKKGQEIYKTKGEDYEGLDEAKKPDKKDQDIQLPELTMKKKALLKYLKEIYKIDLK